MQGVVELHSGSDSGDSEVGLHTDTAACPKLALGTKEGAGGGATWTLAPGSEVNSVGGDDFFFGGRGLGCPLDCCAC